MKLTGAPAARTLRVFFCTGPLAVIHAHIIERECFHPAMPESILLHTCWISDLAVKKEMWARVLPLEDTRPEYGKAPQRISNNLKAIEASLDFAGCETIQLFVSDLFWLMNNVLVATLARQCRRRGIEFELSILDEGSVLYTVQRLGVRRTLRCWAKFLYLRVRGFPALLLHPGNVDYFHPLCRRVFCLHPDLLHPPARVQVERIDTAVIEGVYGNRLPALSLPPRSCLYLSQPLYKLVGAERQIAVVRDLQRRLREEGIQHFCYKPHHADLPFWTARLERECGMAPLEMRETLPIELMARRCNAEVLASHSCSALLNVKAYGFSGRVVAYGLNQLRQSFQEASQMEQLYRAFQRVGMIELIDADNV